MRTQWHLETRRGYPGYHARFAVILCREGDTRELTGETLNVSRGGALLLLSSPIEIGARYFIHFVDETNALDDGAHQCESCGHRSPPPAAPSQALWARALRQGAGVGGFAAAFEFETLLEVLEPAA